MIAPITITQKRGRSDLPARPRRVHVRAEPDDQARDALPERDRRRREAQATVDFYAADPATIHYEASILFTGSPDIDIAGGQRYHAAPVLHGAARTSTSAQSKIFAITGHTHQLGTDVKVRVAPSKTGPMTEVYAPEPFSWSEPETTTSRARSRSRRRRLRLRVHVDEHDAPAAVKFGESANDEMCFFWAYYYPSQGSKVCVHTEQYGGANGINMCCPGDSLCSLIESQL